MNALSPAVKAGLQTSVPRVIDEPAVLAIVLTGTGKAFCAGGDIRAMQGPQERKAPAVRARMGGACLGPRAARLRQAGDRGGERRGRLAAALPARFSPTSSLPAATPIS
jgi:enoyl-CoA hydratase/carnithine racemase